MKGMIKTKLEQIIKKHVNTIKDLFISVHGLNEKYNDNKSILDLLKTIECLIEEVHVTKLKQDVENLYDEISK